MKRIKVNDVELSYRDEGTGEPLIFLHAFALTKAMWDEQVTYFSPSYRVITFDWRGFGQSTLGEKHPSMDVFADDLVGLMDGLQIERATICGLSMGGYATFAFHRKYSFRIASLILADTRAGDDSEETRKTRYEMAELVRREGAAVLPDKVLNKWLAPSTFENHPEIVEQVRSMIANNQAEGIARAQMAMAERKNSVPDLEQIKCPTLIVVGENDAITPLSEAEAMKAGIANSEFEIITGAGHLSNLENKVAFNQAIAKFMNANFLKA